MKDRLLADYRVRQKISVLVSKLNRGNLLGAVLVFLVAAPLVVSAPGCSRCKHRLLHSSVSPSGDYRAELVARNCGMVSGLVVRTGPAQFDTLDDVFIGLIPGRGHDAGSEMWSGAIRLEWVGDAKLLVVHASVLSPALQTVKSGRVLVEYRPVDELNPPLPRQP